ncbi:MAG: 2-isopropylmalate synthase [Desulfurococcales archaeon]|nr:2-isopropylmalate synthase [Desulfurococcales archaeon]
MGSGSEGNYEFFRDVFPGDRPPRIVVSGGGGNYDAWLTDTTLRDGQQGWRTLTVTEALQLYKVLVELAEGGTILSTELFPYTHRDREIVREVLKVGAEYPKPIGWIRSRREDVRLAKEAGLNEVVMLASISDYHIAYKFRLSRADVFAKYLEAIRYAYEQGLTVRVTLEDATRADLEGAVLPFLRKVQALAESFGEELRVKIADTLGLGLPFPEVPPPRGIPQLVRAVVNELNLKPRQLEFHGHNDLGLVVANHLAAWMHGAGLSNCTLFGIGERSGNCPLEIMMVHYVGLTGRNANLKAVKKAASIVRDMGFEIPEFYPLVGSNAFRTKAGIHVDGLMKNPEVYLPFDPIKVLGIPYTVAITPYSGRSAIALWMNRYVSPHTGVRYGKNDALVNKVYDEVVKLFEATGRRHPLTDEELWSIINKYIPNLPKEVQPAGEVEEIG